MGDQLGYGEWFLDALGMLHDNLLAMSTSSVDEVIAALELANRRL